MGLLQKTAIGIAGLILCAMPAAAATAPIEICTGHIVYPFMDGRLLGHLPYGDASPFDLVAAPPGFGIGENCLIQRAAAVDLTRLLNAANAVPEVANQLRGVSCHRSISRQRAVFCGQVGPGRRFATPGQRAQYVAPPGFSEHSTGYTIDFGIRPALNCFDVDPCIASTAAGRWLAAHARDYGFELSFPWRNKQGVTWEPWHWRWVGTSPSAPGAVQARAIFARARTTFAANPAVIDASAPWPQQPAKPATSPILPTPPGRVEIPPGVFPPPPKP